MGVEHVRLLNSLDQLFEVMHDWKVGDTFFITCLAVRKSGK